MSYAKEPYPLHGSCACNTTHYILTLPPLIVHCCHCTACQRQLGTSFAINALVETHGITVLPREPTTCVSSINPAFVRLTNSTTPIAAAPKPKESPQLELTRITLPTESGTGQTTVSCPACHTVLWNHYEGSGPHLAFLRVGTLDEPWRVQPDAHIYTRSKSPFTTIGDGKPQFEGYYPDRRAFYRPETLRRVAELEAKVAAYRKQLAS